MPKGIAQLIGVGNYVGNAVASVTGRSSSQGPRRSCQKSGRILNSRQMHIPPWLWFRRASAVRNA